ncbi:hypothetical protein Syun_022441 [Stephania yunnanensis]|uniref:Peroxidase n=1 Tax=Stephania yunnanensis TaxID=152371 RepID=A0AAP0F9I6_9MAGN
MASSLAFLASSTLMLLLLILNNNVIDSQAQLSPSFYDRTCPNALSTIQAAVKSAVSRERRMAASLLRLHFHDCFVQGCDASLLLNNGPSITSEKSAFQNAGSLRGYEVIDAIKSRVEKVCPGVVSCADILAVVARDATVAAGGPSWTVKLGRRDSTTASRALAEANIPRATATLDDLLKSFRDHGFNARELVILSGAHTIGQATCGVFRARLYNNGTNIDPGFRATRRRNCPINGGDGNLAPLDLVTPNSFDNNYFINLVNKKGLLPTDQALFNGGSTDAIVTGYSRNNGAFRSDFAAAMVKMGDIRPLVGSAGQIRRICSAPN